MYKVFTSNAKTMADLKVIALLHEEVKSVLQILEHRPLQESLSLAESLQTLSLPGQPHVKY